MRQLDAHIPKLIDRMAAGHDGPVAIAVSGGSDSLALLYLADLWAQRAGRDLIVLTVDHGLRPEAAQEASQVAAIAAGLGHEARVLVWTPDRSGQDAARSARHHLLAQAAREAGASLMLLGHTRDDVEETVLMRLSRPTDLVSAVGPQPVSVSPVWPEGRGLVLARPLIGTRRALLQDWLTAKGASWISDPSNDARKYERVRVRALMSGLPGGGALAAVVRDAVLLRGARDSVLAGDIAACLDVTPSGLIELSDWPQGPGRLARLMQLALQAAGGTSVPAARPKIDQLCETILAGGPEARLTLGGGWVQRRDEILLIGREPGEVGRSWDDGVWDGRYVRSDVASPEGIPFLVRHAVPPDGRWREVVSDRLAHWAGALRAGAAIGADIALSDDAGALTRHPA